MFDQNSKENKVPLSYLSLINRFLCWTEIQPSLKTSNKTVCSAELSWAVQFSALELHLKSSGADTGTPCDTGKLCRCVGLSHHRQPQLLSSKGEKTSGQSSARVVEFSYWPFICNWYIPIDDKLKDTTTKYQADTDCLCLFLSVSVCRAWEESYSVCLGYLPNGWICGVGCGGDLTDWKISTFNIRLPPSLLLNGSKAVIAFCFYLQILWCWWFEIQFTQQSDETITTKKFCERTGSR